MGIMPGGVSSDDNTFRYVSELIRRNIHDQPSSLYPSVRRERVRIDTIAVVPCTESGMNQVLTQHFACVPT